MGPETNLGLGGRWCGREYRPDHCPRSGGVGWQVRRHRQKAVGVVVMGKESVLVIYLATLILQLARALV